jgi:PncC family amidohydrolase
MTEPQDYILPRELLDSARKVIDANRARGKTVAVAESCTGGLISAALTEIPGSSDVFLAGFVTYANEAKIDMVGVSRDVLETFGAVSVAVAWSMAQGALARSDADVAVAITGVAGTRRRDRAEAGRNGGLRAGAKGCRSQGDRRRSPRPRQSRTRRYPPSGRVMRARAAHAGGALSGAVKLVGAALERADHAPERAIEHLPGQGLEDAGLEREIDAEVDVGSAFAVRLERSSCCRDI